MAKKGATVVASTPTTLKKSNSSSAQRTLHGFFTKTPSTTQSTKSSDVGSTVAKADFSRMSSVSDLTPVPSSDAPEPEEEDTIKKVSRHVPTKCLPLRISANRKQTNGTKQLSPLGAPSRRVSETSRRLTSVRLTMCAGEEEGYQLCRVR